MSFALTLAFVVAHGIRVVTCPTIGAPVPITIQAGVGTAATIPFEAGICLGPVVVGTLLPLGFSSLGGEGGEVVDETFPSPHAGR